MANNQKVVVVVLPFPVQGHLVPLLDLSRRIAACDVPVYFVSSETALQQATAICHGWDPSATANLHLHGYPTTSSDQSMWVMTDASSTGFEEPLSSLLRKLEPENHTRVVCINDTLISAYVKRPVHSIRNVESYAFETCSAFTFMSSIWEGSGKPEGLPEDAEMMEHILSMEGCLYDVGYIAFMGFQYQIRDMRCGTIFNSTRVAQGLYLDLLAKLPPYGIWSVGPLNPVVPHARSIINSECLDWLDKRPANSVVLVSFGTTSPLSDDQMSDIALGLELSDVGFVWLLRNADDHIFEDYNLLQGFEERVSERGIIVREWGPEVEILEHGATGGFMSHCGWDSCMECISTGVLVAAWPVNADQARSALLMTKVLQVGLEVEPSQKDEELVYSFTLVKAVRRLMDSEEGDEMRQRAKKLADSVNDSMKKDGTAATAMEMDSFIAHITRN